MSVWIAVGLGVAVLVLLYLRQKDSKGGSVAPAPARKLEAGASKRAKPEPVKTDKFTGSMIVPQKDCCAAVLKLRGRTFPPGHVHQVPVPGCEHKTCECKINEIRGRRNRPRRMKTDRRDDVRFKDDRRKGKDRRQGVDAWNRGNA